MPHNNVRIFALATAICLTATASSANSSLFGDDLKNDEAVVLQLQTKLNELGFDAGPTDGAWGRRTAGAVDAFTERFPPVAPFSEASALIDRLQLIHDSWFASPFSSGNLITPQKSLVSQQIVVSDIRSDGIACEPCNVSTFVLGAGDFDGDQIDEVLLGLHVSVNFRNQNVPTSMMIIDRIETGNAELLKIPGATASIRRVHEREAAIADFNGDGIDDFFIAAHGLDAQPFPGEQNILVLSSPTGLQDRSDTNIPQINDMSHGADAGDIDGDGDYDIVVMTNDGSEKYEPYVLFNDGTGAFEMQPLASIVDAPQIITLYAGRNRANQFSSARLLDLNNDALPELLLLRSDPSESRQHTNTTSHIFWNSGTGTFSADNMTNLPTDRWSSVTFTNDAEAIDLDGDGLMDLILTQSTRETNSSGEIIGNWHGQFIQILRQAEGGYFVDETAERIWPQGYSLPLNEIHFADETELVDLDEDGDVDIVTRSFSPAMTSLSLDDAIIQIGINDGNGHFAPLNPRWLSANQDYRFRSPLPGRFGPDGQTGILSYSVYGIFNETTDITWGADFSLSFLSNH